MAHWHVVGSSAIGQEEMGECHSFISLFDPRGSLFSFDKNKVKEGVLVRLVK